MSTPPETPVQEEHEQGDQSSMVAGIPSSEWQASQHARTVIRVMPDRRDQ